MKKTLFILLITLSPAFADDQANIYDFNRRIAQDSDSTLVDEQLTATIKRHMANLLYPVDLTSFVRPEAMRNFASKLSYCRSRWGHRQLES